jgi:hypothetical protein
MRHVTLPVRAVREPAAPTHRSALADLFAPVDRLLRTGGDPRLEIDLATGANQYGCPPAPALDFVSFASSTASPVSQRAYDRLGAARDALIGRAISLGVEGALDLRLEEMRNELRT